MTERQAHMLKQHMGDRDEAELLMAEGGFGPEGFGWEYERAHAAAPLWAGGQPQSMWVGPRGYTLYLRGMCTFQLYYRQSKVDGCRGTHNLGRLLARPYADAVKAAA